jgi:hypothetical protein
MTIKDIRVKWNIGLDTSPILQILVSRVEEKFTYDELKQGDRALYYGITNDQVSFFAYDPSKPNGYGGRSFTLPMKDGSVKIIDGPWASRAGVVNNFFSQCIDVELTDTKTVWKKGSSFYSGHILLETVQTFIDKEKEKRFWTMIKVFDYGDITYIPTLKGITDPCKICKGFGKIESASIMIKKNPKMEIKETPCTTCSGSGIRKPHQEEEQGFTC